MTIKTWHNFVVGSVHATGKDGHILADDLRERITVHDGTEAYHGVFDLEQRDDFSQYIGQSRPAMGYVWFDFDSHDGGHTALQDCRRFVHNLRAIAFVAYYSGSKGFHVGVPAQAFENTAPNALHELASTLKADYPTLDTSIYSAFHKLRLPGSAHPKTGLFKVIVNDLAQDLADIKAYAKEAGIEVPPIPLQDCEVFFRVHNAPDEALSPKEFIKIRPHDGATAFKECAFLRHCEADAATLTEPEWYALASIVGRFTGGPELFHTLSRPHPGYDAKGAAGKLNQAITHGPRTCAGIAKLGFDCSSCPHFGKLSSPVVIMSPDVIPTEAQGFWFTDSEGKDRPCYRDLLAAFSKDNQFRAIADMKTIYTFRETHYIETFQMEVKAFTETRMSPPPNERIRAEFLHKVLANNVCRREFFDNTTRDKINFKNCILDLSDNTVTPHSSDIGFRHCLPFDYAPDAKCPKFEGFLLDIMLNDAVLVQILQEFIGYVVRGGDYIFHKALWLAGNGRNGKSTLLDVVKALIGPQAHSNVPIKHIINDKFSSSMLDGMLANFCEETSPEELSDSGPFKNLTGDGDVIAQKKFGNLYSFRNRAKLIMTYNEMPILKDLSAGMMSRPLVIPFKKDLTDESQQDHKLKEKLLAELPGIFNFAMVGWRRLDRQQHFTHSDKCKAAMQDIEAESCSATRWINECVTFDQIAGLAYTTIRIMYPSYSEWCGKVGAFKMGEQKFSKRVNAHPEAKTRRRHTEDGWKYFGMSFASKNL